MRVAFVLTIGLALPATTLAAPMEARFTGRVTSGSDLNANTFSTSVDLAGLPAELSLFFDPDALPPDTNALPGVVQIGPAISFLRATVTIGGITNALDTRSTNELIARDFAAGFLDRLTFSAVLQRSIVVAADEIVTADAFHRDLFPPGGPLDLAQDLDLAFGTGSSRASGRVRLYDHPSCTFCPPGRFTDGELHIVDASFVFTRLRVRAVPEPGALGFLAMAALSLRARRRAPARAARSRPSRDTRP